MKQKIQRRIIFILWMEVILGLFPILFLLIFAYKFGITNIIIPTQQNRWFMILNIILWYTIIKFNVNELLTIVKEQTKYYESRLKRKTKKEI